MKLYFLKDIPAVFAPGGKYKKGSVYDVPHNNVPTMLDNGFAVPEDQKPVRKPRAKKVKK